MNRLLCVASLALAASTCAFGNAHKEAPMMAASAPMATAGSCATAAAEKKLSGAARTSFVKKCEADASSTCEAQATEKKLAGAAKTSFTKKCVADAKGPDAVAACDAQAAEKKLAGAAKASFTKKCVADAKAA